MSGAVQSLRATWRSLAKSPAYAIATVAILALGVGANAAIFSIVRATLLAPLPFPDADRIARIWETYSKGAGRGSVSLPNFRDWRAQADSFESLAVYRPASRNLQGVAEPERILVLESSASLFDVLGVRAAVGRFFSADEERLEAAPTVVLSDRFWRRRLGADPSIVGRTVVLDGAAHTVVGVAPAAFRYPVYGREIEAFLPHRMTIERADDRGSHYLSVLGKLRPGVPLAHGREQLEQVAARIEKEYPDEQTGRSVELKSLDAAIRGPVKESLLVLFAAVGVVLVIAGANLVGLALARAADRRRDVSIRAALGASRLQLVRELFVEGLILTAAGVAAGALLARGLLALLAEQAAEALPQLGPIALDRGVFAFLLAIGGATGLLFGLLPAWAVSKDAVGRDLVETSTRSTGGRGRQRARRTLVGAQVALSVTLLVGAGLLIRTFLRLQSTAPGFDRVGVLTLHMNPTQSSYDGASVGPRLLTPVLERVRALPGVEQAGFVSILPVQNWGSNSSYSIDGLEKPQPGSEWWVETRVATPGVFEALGVPLRQGRLLTDADATTPGVADDAPFQAVVNEAFVRRHFPDGRALDRVVRFGDDVAGTIVGVVGDVRQGGLDQEPLPELTFSAGDVRRTDSLLYDTVLVVRASVPPASLTPAVRAAIAAVDPQQPIHTVKTLDEVVAESLSDRRFNLLLVAAFAAVAIVLAGTGLYALVAYLVVQRTREVGVRMALGATARQISRWVLREGLALAGFGAVAGLVGGWGASRLVASQLAGVHPFDPATWIAVVAFLVLVALAATLAPAARAARVDPIHVLRQE